MGKRFLAVLLWFYGTWMLWNAIALVTSLSVTVGPLVAAAVAAAVAVDPTHKLWKHAA